MARMRLHVRTVVIAAGVAGAICGLTALAIAGSDGSPTNAPANTPSASGTPGAWATATQAAPGLSFDAAVARVTAGLASVATVGVSLAPGLPDQADAEIPALRIDVRPAGASDLSDVTATWLAELAQGAVADLMNTGRATTRAVIGGGRYDLTEDGTTKDLGGGTGSVRSNQSFTAQQDGRSDGDIAEAIDAVLVKFGLEPQSVEVVHPLGPAVAVVATVPDGLNVTWTIGDLRSAITGDPSAYEGVEITLVSPSGSILLEEASAYRMGGGGLSFSAGQDDRFGAAHGGIPPAA